MQKLISKSKFAELAGVNPSTVTRLCDTVLKDALVDKKIDLNHIAAKNYLKSKENNKTKPAATGLDPLYEKAVIVCQQNGSASTNLIKRELNLGYDRAKKLFDIIKINGVVDINTSQKTEIKEKPKPISKYNRGNAAAKEAKKKEALSKIEKPEQTFQHEQHYQPKQPEEPEIDVDENIKDFLNYKLIDLIKRFGTDVGFLDWLRATKTIEDIEEKRLKNAEKSGELIRRDIVSEGMIAPLDGAFKKMLTDGAKTIAVRSTALIKAGASVEDIEKLVSNQLSSFINPTKSKLKRVLKNA